jgi:hypothetical protein
VGGDQGDGGAGAGAELFFEVARDAWCAQQNGYDRHVEKRSDIEASGTFCINDLARSNFLGVLGQSRRFPWVVAVASILFVALTAFETFSGIAHGYAAPIALFVLIFVYVNSVKTFRGLRKDFDCRRYFRDPVKYVFTDETITTLGTGIRSAVVWASLVRVRETASLFKLYVGPRGFVIVPKRFFQSSEEIDKWRQLIASRVDPKLIAKPSFLGRWC